MVVVERSNPLEAARRPYCWGLRQLQRDGKLRKALEGYIDPIYHHVGVETFRNGAASSEERAVLDRERWAETKRRIESMRAELSANALVRARMHGC